MAISILTDRIVFPDPREADDEGLVAIGGDMSVPRLLAAYSSGIFPWTVDPVTWWSPDPRAIFELNSFHVSKSLQRVLRQERFQITADKAFREVMHECARSAKGRRSTWITTEFVEAYSELHRLGNAHSMECWHEGKLVGGIYGVSINAFFAGESMFHRADDASKVALYHLIQRLQRRQFRLFDIQMLTPITRQLGGVEICREEYLRRLGEAVKAPANF